MEPFSSISDRPRDALLLSLHQRELAQKDLKISRLQRANDESLKRTYEAQHRGNRLAQALGFRDVFEAQMAIDVAGEEISYRECFERVVSLEEEVGQARRVNEELKERVKVLQREAELGGERDSEELVKLRAENKALLERIDALESDQTRQDDENQTTASSAATTISRLEQELKQLQDRYDDLLTVKERAAVRYKLDYAIWKRVKEWFFNEESEMDEEGISEEEKKRRFKKRLMMKKRILMEIEDGAVPTPSPFSKPPPLGGIENKENQTPPRPQLAQPPHSHSSANRIPSLRNKLLDAVAHPKPPSSSPNLFNEGALPRSLPSTNLQESAVSQNHENSDPDPDPPSSPSPKDVNGNNMEPRSSPTVVGTASKPLRNKLLESVVHKKSMSSPTVTNIDSITSSSSRQPLVFEPVTVVKLRSASVQAKHDIRSSPTPLAEHDISASSETQEDSQDVEPAPLPLQSQPQHELRIPMIPTSPAPVLSSETEADSQSQMFSLPFINLDPTPCPARPAKPPFLQSQSQTPQSQQSKAQPQTRIQVQTGSIATSLGLPSASTKPAFPRDRRVVSSRDEESLRAKKMRRLEGDNAEMEEVMGRERRSSVMGEKEGRGRERKGKERDVDVDVDVEMPSSTPANPQPQHEFRTPMILTSPAPVLSSETEADSQSQMFSLPFINLDPTPCPARPAKPSFLQSQSQPHQGQLQQPQPQPQTRIQTQTGSITTSLPFASTKPAFPRDRWVISSRDGESLPARKMRRVEGDDAEEMGRERKSSVMGEKEKERKGKERDVDVDVDVEMPSSTPANPPPSTAQKRIEDYSVYKGRGRYGKNATAPKESINARFEIDPVRNGGLDYQYDEVVRGRNDRKRMDAGDCECCRDYYEAVGPLPKRLQAPLWRSPPATPATKSRACPRHGSGSASASGSKSKSTSARSHSYSHSNGNKRQREKENEITSHRQAISRHRHHWDRPKTPPGYWNIGFPDTQETEEINEKAREMHRRKREAVEREVDGRGGREEGRWRRRG